MSVNAAATGLIHWFRLNTVSRNHNDTVPQANHRATFSPNGRRTRRPDS
jgi:hypothetical protein